jgi:hypothetical protein
MLPAINLDDEALLAAHEIDNEWSDRLLTDELEAAESAIA